MKQAHPCGILLLLLSPVVYGADVEYSKPYAACMERADGVTMEMIVCITEENRRQDARLNQAYRAAMVQLSTERQKPLQEAQRAWLKFRDANCAFYDDPEGGSLARVTANECVLSATASRAQELELIIQPLGQ